MATPKISAPNPMEEIVSVFIPKESGEDEMFFVGLNGRNWNIPRGKTVQVPKPIADIVEQHNKFEEEAEIFRKEKKRMMNVVQGV